MILWAKKFALAVAVDFQDPHSHNSLFLLHRNIIPFSEGTAVDLMHTIPHPKQKMLIGKKILTKDP